jgi:hypothetical protein
LPGTDGLDAGIDAFQNGWGFGGRRRAILVGEKRVRHPSGLAADVVRPEPAESRHVRPGLHEFSVREGPVPIQERGGADKVLLALNVAFEPPARIVAVHLARQRGAALKRVEVELAESRHVPEAGQSFRDSGISMCY